MWWRQDVTQRHSHTIVFRRGPRRHESETLKHTSMDFSRSLSKDVAERIVQLAAQIPRDSQEPYTQWFLSQFMGSIEQVAAGGAPTDAHVTEVEALNKSPLDESAAEGWHRETTLLKKRAAAAKLAWLKANDRLHQNLDRVTKWVLRHGNQARQIVTFEWKSFKRLIQTKLKKRWRRFHCQDHCGFSSAKHTSIIRIFVLPTIMF